MSHPEPRPFEEVCPFGQPVGESAHLTRCPRWPWCPCLYDLMLHAVGHDDVQTDVIARWWTDHWGGETLRTRETLPEFEHYANEGEF